LRRYVPPTTLPTPVATSSALAERPLSPPKLERADHD
jgi:hypothetical protein